MKKKDNSQETLTTLTIELPISIKKRLKTYSVKSDIYMRDIALIALENYLQKYEKKLP